jgi:hypothetical protein
MSLCRRPAFSRASRMAFPNCRRRARPTASASRRARVERAARFGATFANGPIRNVYANHRPSTKLSSAHYLERFARVPKISNSSPSPRTKAGPLLSSLRRAFRADLQDRSPGATAMNRQAPRRVVPTFRRRVSAAYDESPRFRRPIGEDSYQSLIRVDWRFIVDNRVRAWRFIAIGHAPHWRFIATTLQVHRGQPGWQGFSGRPCWPVEPHRPGGARANR